MTLKRCFKNSTMPETVEGKEFMLYYNGANIKTRTIKCVTDDNTYQIESLGIKTLESIEKYTVDILGEYHPVRKEKRQGFQIKRS